MKIAGCLIVKDDSELEGLKKAVFSLPPQMPVYITATGPIPDVQKIQIFCKDFKFHYSHFTWCDDFSKARTFNFSQVKEPIDYYFWLDSDDVLINGDLLYDVAQIAQDNGKDVVFFTYWYGCRFSGDPSPETLQEVLMEQMRERLIKPGVTKWMGRLHETPVPVSGAKNNYTTYAYDAKERPIVIMHTSPDTGLDAKMKRNQRILELQLQDERKRDVGADPRTLLYLMKIYAQNDTEAEWELCLPMGEEYLSKSGWNEERATCYEQMGIVAGKRGDQQKAAEYFHEAIREWPHQPLLHIRLATAYFNLQNYRFAEYWMQVGAQMDIDNKGSNLTNIKAMKLMYSELLMKMAYVYQKDTKKTLEAAKLFFAESPTLENEQQVAFLEDINNLNDACGHFDKLAKYLDDIGETNIIVPLLEKLPPAISSQPFAQKLRNSFAQARIWGADEICYFANFGAAHFEPWSGKSLTKGIGGSETAVIELSRHWVEKGYRVTVFGDPQDDKGTIDGVTYLPWYHFNPRDSFNIFIQWRVPNLAGKIKAKKFLVDLHDVFAEVDYDTERLNNIDRIMVKSQYQRSLAPHIPDEKFMIVGNGI